MDVQKYLEKGYVVVSEGDQFITLKKKKSVSLVEGLLIVVGFPLLFVMGIGLICWLLAVLNYLIKSEKTITLSK